jgi:hypothetical protein
MQAPQVPRQLSWQLLQVAQLWQVPLQLSPQLAWQLALSQLASGVSTHSGLGQLGYEPHCPETGSTVPTPTTKPSPRTVPRPPAADAVSNDSTCRLSMSSRTLRIKVLRVMKRLNPARPPSRGTRLDEERCAVVTIDRSFDGA